MLVEARRLEVVTEESAVDAVWGVNSKVRVSWLTGSNTAVALV